MELSADLVKDPRKPFIEPPIESATHLLQHVASALNANYKYVDSLWRRGQLDGIMSDSAKKYRRFHLVPDVAAIALYHWGSLQGIAPNDANEGVARVIWALLVRLRARKDGKEEIRFIAQGDRPGSPSWVCADLDKAYKNILRVCGPNFRVFDLDWFEGELLELQSKLLALRGQTYRDLHKASVN